tara:strand:- start:820 stop:1290 length:471 start_codon:yes stop_codon:yes gene_type:complete
MAYKQKSNGLPFKQMGSTPAKQVEADENKYPKPNFEIHSYEVDLSKKSGLGPSAAFGGSKNRELVPDKKANTKKVMKDGAVNKTHAAWLAKNKSNFEKMTAAEKKALQDKADAKRKAFEATDAYKKRRAAIDNKKASQEGESERQAKIGENVDEID